jgi:limonene 1,2-monooxygenase
MAHEWADRVETLRSYELFSRYVMPAFQGSSDTLAASRDWAADNRPTFIGAAGAAVFTAIQNHNDERAKAAEAARSD